MMNRRAITSGTSRGVALIMVLLVLTTLAFLGMPFVLSMTLQDRESHMFSGRVTARLAAIAARNHTVAHLQRTSYSVEWESEAEEIEAERPGSGLRRGATSRRATGLKDASRSLRGTRSRVVRADLGEKERGPGERRASGESRTPGGDGLTGLHESLKISRLGPSAREHDEDDEIDTELPSRIEAPPGTFKASLEAGAPRSTAELRAAGDGPEILELRDASGIYAHARVSDEQGRVNVDTAPPHVIGSLFGVTELAVSLGPQDTKMALMDAAVFRGDHDEKTLDGAVVIEHPGTGAVEAITYTRRIGSELTGLFRGAFFSLRGEPPTYPIGSLVYDLRGWKIGYHRLWARREGGFHPPELTRFRSIEALREIAGWQTASLFLGRFRGEGLTAEFLREQGVSVSRVVELGLDPYIFLEEGGMNDRELRARYRTAERVLRRSRFPSILINRLRKARGMQVVIELAARLEGASREDVEKVEKVIAQSLEGSELRTPDFPRGYLQKALENLVEVYRTPGIETLLPEDIERIRPYVTTRSRVESLWSEAQTLLEDVIAGAGRDVSLERGSDFNRRAVVRVRSRENPGYLEYNEVAGAGPGGFTFGFPPRQSLKGYDALVQALQRHPVNINTASRRVLRAVFAGLTAGGGEQTVTLYEADQLAAAAIGRRPFRDHSEFRDFLEEQAEADVIDEEDFEIVLLNAVQPTHPRLARGTVGFTYATGDVYTIESRAVLRTPGGRRVAEEQLRELIDVSAAGRRGVGLLTQRDFADGAYLFPPGLGGADYPEAHHRYLMSFPGVRSHLVQTRPLLLHRAPRYFPGGDPGDLRLMPSTSPDGPAPFMVGRVLSFENTYDGTELPHGAPFVTDFGAGGGVGAGAGAGPGEGAGGGLSDLSTVPGGIEFWMRLRTYPEARSTDGHMILMEAGQASGDLDGATRNRIALLYDQRRSAFLLRVHDASLRDPSIEVDEETGQYLEVAARRPLELETWYHLRAVWDGVHGSGCQLFIDGVPAGEDNLSGELVNAIAAPTSSAPRAGSIVVRGADRFPREGVVRIGDELFEYESRSGNSLTLRQEMAYQGPAHAIKRNPSDTAWFLFAGDDPLFEALGLRPRDTGGAAVAPPASSSPSPALGGSATMRGPWNRRGSVGSAHPAGARVTLHGYSREIRRKIKLPTGLETQVTGAGLVWGRGGLRMVGDLPAFNFPPGVHDIFHYEINPMDVGQTEDRWLVPLFHLDGSAGHPEETAERQDGRRTRIDVGGRVLRNLAVSLPGARGNRQASDYFQDRGICVVTFRAATFSIAPADARTGERVSTSGIRGGRYALFYEKLPLPPAYQKVIGAEFPRWLQGRAGPLMGLRITGGYVFGGGGAAGGGGANPAAELGQQLVEFWTRAEEVEKIYQQLTGVDPKIRIAFPVSPRSVLADGEIGGRYPATGILELRGVPALWEPNQGRSGSPLQDIFRTRSHPDDVVEWLRYVDIVDDSRHGHLFVGRVDETDNFRGYPEDAPRRSDRDVDQRRQLDHAGGEPLRLVMELSEGGAGRGDYVTIASRDARRHESRVHRVFKTAENIDGRFFASLMPADGAGQQGFDYAYRRDDDPRLVKFPSWALPQEGSGNVVFFGSIGGAGANLPGGGGRGGGRAAEYEGGWVRQDGERDTTGATLDEIKMYRNTTVSVNPSFGPRVRFVVAPLPIRLERDGSGLASISGEISSGRAVSPANPLDVLVVSVSRERGAPSTFAAGQKEGLVRIGEELFYFEDPRGDESAQEQGTAAFRDASPLDGSATQSAEGERPPRAALNPGGPDHLRNRLTRTISAANFRGHFEPEGFARLHSSTPYLAEFYEVFYYRQQGGGGFQEVLRGQFGTPLLGESRRIAEGDGSIRSVTRRLRLIGRSLLGTARQTHSLGSPIAFVPYVNATPVNGPLTNTGISVRHGERFTKAGYLIMDPGVPGVPWEIVGHLGAAGEGVLRRARDEQGRGMLRARFGTRLRPISPDLFAVELPYRYPDRYEPRMDSESMAYLQKSFRVPGARWRALEWLERPGRAGRDRRIDVIVLARFDGGPEWDAEPTNRSGGLYLFEERSRSRSSPARFEFDEVADELEVRIYFRYLSGAYTRLGDDVFSDDWKETPVLEALHVEYEKPTTVLRHERLPF